jgi:hypothetical protein
MEEHMIRGIKFEIPNRHWKIINIFLSLLDSEAYVWHIVHEEICSDKEENFIGCFDGKGIFDVLPIDDYYTISIDLYGYKKVREHLGEAKIKSSLLPDIYISICDVVFVEMFARDIKDLLPIIEYIRKEKFLDITDIFDYNMNADFNNHRIKMWEDDE